MHRKGRKGELIEYGLGDRGIANAFGNNPANIEAAVYCRCLRNVEAVTRTLSGTAEEQRFRGWVERIYNAYNRPLLVTGKQQHP
jgi:hypothetical protein